jgi:hypothetical protein
MKQQQKTSEYKALLKGQGILFSFYLPTSMLPSCQFSPSPLHEATTATTKGLRIESKGIV